jgi:hypothetical protein
LSLLNGVGTLLSRSVSDVSNIILTTTATSSTDRAKQNRKAYQIIVRGRAQRSENKGFTRCGIATQIGESQTLKSKLHPTAEQEDPTKNKLFVAVASLEPNPMELSHPLYQHLQVRHLFRILPLIDVQQQKKMLVRPLGHVTQIDVEPSSGGAFPTAPEGALHVLLLVVAAQRQPNAGKYLVLIGSSRVKVPE